MDLKPEIKILKKKLFMGKKYKNNNSEEGLCIPVQPQL